MQKTWQKLMLLSWVCSSTAFAGDQDAANHYTKPGGKEIAELVTDRPDFTESSEIAPQGWVQWESGFSWYRRGTTNSALLGAPLLRIGLMKRLELRLSTDGYLKDRDDSLVDRGGRADAAVGFKYKFVDESRFFPAVSLIHSISIPNGHQDFSSRHHDPLSKITWSKGMPLGFEASGNFNFVNFSDEIGTWNQKSVTLSVGHGFGERFGGYWEVYSFDHDERGGRRMSIFQTGLTMAAGKHSQFDVSVGTRMSQSGPNTMIAFGWATRAPLGIQSMLRRMR
jgi:hypothetical protein